MTSSPAFIEWATDQLSLSDAEVRTLKLEAVFDLFIARIELARAHGAARPLATVTAKAAGGNSRAATRRMLDQLRFTSQQRRAIHRLMGGSPSGWPGLLTLFVDGRSLNQAQVRYARRQVDEVTHAADECRTHDSDLRISLRQSSAGCVSNASAP